MLVVRETTFEHVVNLFNEVTRATVSRSLVPLLFVASKQFRSFCEGDGTIMSLSFL